MKRTNFIPAALLALITCATIILLVTFNAQTHPVSKPGSSSAGAYSSAPTSADVEKNTYDIVEDVPADPNESAVTTEVEETPPTEPAEKPSSPSELASKPSPACCSYCGSQDHSYNHCAQRFVDNGAMGRWIIPAVGINVATYTGDKEARQAICDKWDSAVYLKNCGLVSLIADHSNQEFSSLKYVSVGQEAYMDYGSYKQKYVCTKVAYGHNDGHVISDADWVPLLVYDSYCEGITCYTCNGNWRNIILVSFQPINS